jgi:peptidoglycan/LPS O-acetylase OafA/YrhL
MSTDALSKALFFWFPNQLSVFSLGGIVYFLINDYGTICRRFLLGRGMVATFTAALLFCASAFVPLGHFIGDVPVVPASLAVSIVFMIVIIVLSNGPNILVNRAVANMGKVSFSAYLIHFAILDMEKSFPDFMHTHEKGYQAILGFAVSWPMTVLLIFILSWLSFKFVEGPAIALGRLINHSRSKAKSYLPAPS